MIYRSRKSTGFKCFIGLSIMASSLSFAADKGEKKDQRTRVLSSVNVQLLLKENEVIQTGISRVINLKKVPVEIEKRALRVQICNTKKCVTLSEPQFETLGKANAKVSIRNFMTPNNSSFDLKVALATAMKEGIAPAEAKLQVTVLELQKIDALVDHFWEKDWVHLNTNKDELSDADIINLFYVAKAPVVFDVFNQRMFVESEVKGTSDFTVKLEYVAPDSRFEKYNLPPRIFEERVRNQALKMTPVAGAQSTDTLRDFLALTVAYNMTNDLQGWASIQQILIDERKDEYHRDFTYRFSNGEDKQSILDLSSNKIFKQVIKESLPQLVNLYISQTRDILADALYSMAIPVAAGEKNAEVTAAMVPSQLPLLGYNQLSYQEKLARYQYYTSVVNSGFSTGQALAGLGQSYLNSILR